MVVDGLDKALRIFSWIGWCDTALLLTSTRFRTVGHIKHFPALSVWSRSGNGDFHEAHTRDVPKAIMGPHMLLSVTSYRYIGRRILDALVAAPAIVSVLMMGNREASRVLCMSIGCCLLSLHLYRGCVCGAGHAICWIYGVPSMPNMDAGC